MKLVSRLSIVSICAIAAVMSTGAQSEWTPLWNGRNLEGWTTWMRQPEPTSEVHGLARGADGKYTEPIGTGRDPLQVFTVAPDVDGRPAIRISGEVFGELRTARSLENYHLKLQFRWGDKKWAPRNRPEDRRDSGLLYHVHAPPGQNGRTWARSIELQIQEGDVGDLYAVGSTIAVRATERPGTKPTLFDFDPSGEWMFFAQSHHQDGRCIKQPDNEKPPGEWNTVELIAFGDEAIHIVNGTVVMRLRNPMRIDADVPTPVASGPIILQSEGAEIFYRDIQVRSLKAIPAEFAAK
jgi:hypothetical protein